jgi:uncharacterized alkaline shock family protein YloU
MIHLIMEANPMTTSPATAPGDTTSQRSTSAAVARSGPPGGATLESAQGRTSIADGVVQKIAGIATRDVSGVHQLGGAAARAFSSMRERIPGSSQSVGQGVTVEVGERQAAIDLYVVVEYGVAIADLAQSVRRHVIAAVEGMTGLEVTEVNISVNDIHLPSEEAGQVQEHARVQ